MKALERSLGWVRIDETRQDQYNLRRCSRAGRCVSQGLPCCRWSDHAHMIEAQNTVRVCDHLSNPPEWRHRNLSEQMHVSRQNPICRSVILDAYSRMRCSSSKRCRVVSPRRPYFRPAASAFACQSARRFGDAFNEMKNALFDRCGPCNYPGVRRRIRADRNRALQLASKRFYRFECTPSSAAARLIR